MTRDKSITPAARSLSSIARCIASHTPARCHCRRRFSSVMPQQPISQGKSPQAMPVLSTNRIPVRQTRSSAGGLPTFGRDGRRGSSGRTTSHNASSTSGLAMASSVTIHQPPMIRRRIGGGNEYF